MVRQAVESYWHTQHQGDPPDPSSQSGAWLEALGNAAKALHDSKEEDKLKLLRAMAAAITGAVEGDFAKAQQSAYAKSREAVTHERRVLVHDQAAAAFSGGGQEPDSALAG